MDGWRRGRRTAHSAPDVVSLSDFARCQEDLRGMPTSTVVLHADHFLERKGGGEVGERETGTEPQGAAALKE